MSFERLTLPIDPHLESILTALDRSSSLIIEAPPGTGKTTRVAPALLAAAARLRLEGTIVLVQPRRIAARAAASRIASEMGAPLGQEVGFQVRFESRCGPDTRLIAMTPGILLRRLQGDGVLSDVSAVLLDEFHERSLEYDLLLGMLRRVQLEIRPDLKLIIMSATLQRDEIETYLGGTLTIRVPAENFPVAVRHLPLSSTLQRSKQSSSRRIAELAAVATRGAIACEAGDILVFLPGVGEIEQVRSALARDAEKSGAWEVLPLHGELPSEAQDRVLLPGTLRKVVLATNVAETSLTIDGVRVVVDSGWARVQRFVPASGLNMLRLEPISRASADQRAGRAGRTAPGVCLRLWDQVTDRARASRLEPEILRVDLMGAVLQLLCWGETDVTTFPWITQPRAEAVESALQTLMHLGAVAQTAGSQGPRVTPLGRLLNKLPVHPRLARLLIEGHQLGIARAASLAAALLSERDIEQRASSSEIALARAGLGR